MKTIEHVPQMQLTRQEQLLVWLRREGLSMGSIGEKLGIKRNSVSSMLRKERAPVHRVAQLRELGIPGYLLPRAEDVPSGPKPGWKQRVAANSSADTTSATGIVPA